MGNVTSAARFALGYVAATPDALEVLAVIGKSPQEFLTRHAHGDWGDVSNTDKQLNNDAIRLGDRLVSAYALSGDDRLLIITEADRSRTTVLLSSEY